MNSLMRLFGRKKKKKNERMKENVRNVSEKQENMKLNSVNSRKITCDWLKVLNIYTIKTFFFLCVSIKMTTFALFTAEPWKKMMLKL